MDTSVFSDRLRRLVEYRGYTNAEFAELLGSYPAVVSRYLTGKRLPELSMVLKISELFNVSIDWLFGLNSDQFERLDSETQQMAMRYSIASPDDRRVVDTVLSKYRSTT